MLAWTHFRDNPSTYLKRTLRPPHLAAAFIKSRCNYILRRTLLYLMIPECARIKRNGCLKANETACAGVLNYMQRHRIERPTDSNDSRIWFRIPPDANHFLKAWPGSVFCHTIDRHFLPLSVVYWFFAFNYTASTIGRKKERKKRTHWILHKRRARGWWGRGVRVMQIDVVKSARTMPQLTAIISSFTISVDRDRDVGSRTCVHL